MKEGYWQFKFLLVRKYRKEMKAVREDKSLTNEDIKRINGRYQRALNRVLKTKGILIKEVW